MTAIVAEAPARAKKVKTPPMPAQEQAVAAPLVPWPDPARSFVHRLAAALFNAEQSGEFEGRPAQETLDAASCALYFMAEAPPTDLLWSGDDANHAVTMIRSVSGLLDLAVLQGTPTGDLNDVQAAVVPMVQASLHALQDALALVNSTEAPAALVALEMQDLPQPQRQPAAWSVANVGPHWGRVQAALEWLEAAQDIARCFISREACGGLFDAAWALLGMAHSTGTTAIQHQSLDEAEEFSINLLNCLAVLDASKGEQAHDAVSGVRYVVGVAKEELDIATLLLAGSQAKDGAA